MGYLQVLRFLGLAVVLALVGSAVSTERTLAQTVVEVTAADLRDDPAGADPKKAYEKVNAKIAATTVTAGTVVTFPEGEFKDVGEILITGKKGTAATTSPAAPAKPITFRGNGTVFTGKIKINVFDSEYIVIEGFTFRDTQVPDRFTHFYQEGTDRISIAPHDFWEYEHTGVVWLNLSIETGDCPTGGPVNNVTIRRNEFRNTRRHGIKVFPAFSGSGYTGCRNTSAIEVSDNVFIGIGLGPNADYLDAAKTLPGNRNWKNAIEAQKAYGWTVRNNYIGAERDGTAAAGTTWLGIKIDNAFGKTLIENNVVNGTASSGIVVGGDDSAGAAEAEITIRNNRVTNSRNDAWFVHFWADGFSPQSAGGQPTNGYLGPWTPGAGMLVANAGMTDEQADRLLMPRIYALPSEFTAPFLGASGSRAVSSILDDYASDGNRMNTGDAFPIDSSPGTRTNIPERAVVRNLKPGIEAGIELNRLTAKTILVENNELTDNVVGLSVCPSWYCYADHDFQSLVPASQTPTAGTLKVPTVRNNRIYDNDKATDMPGRFVRADVINALTETNTGEGKNMLVLAGNYLGDSPEVEGAVNTDDLADAAPDDIGPRETEPPVLDADAAGEGAALSGTTITLTYGEELDGDSVPAAAAFTVMQADSAGLTAPIGVTGVAVSGMSVTLTLARAPGSGNSVTVSYDPAKAGSGTGRGPIRDVAGNVALPLAPRTVTAADSMPPGQPMGPGESPQPPVTTGGGDGGCALASGGGGGAEPGALLAMMLAMFVFGLGRNVKKKN